MLTTFQQNNLGIGYIGAIADVRHSEKGELLSLALLNRDRFLFQLKPAVPGKKWGQSGEEPKFDSYGRESIGGVVALDGKSVANLLVRTLDKALLDDIETETENDPDVPPAFQDAAVDPAAAP